MAKPKKEQDVLADGYIENAKNKNDLIERLKKISSRLTELEQDTPTSRLNAVSRVLGEKQFLHHRDSDIRLLVACCLADILRLYAPNAPYTTEQLEEIFSLCIKQIRGLERGDQALNFERHFYLLERLAVVNSFVVVMDMPEHISEELLNEAFSTFFSISKTCGSAKVQQHMVEIMCLCITENDNVSNLLLEQLLESVVSKEEKAAYDLASNVLKRCKDQLQGPLTKYLTNILVNGHTGDSEITGHVHEVLAELNSIEPSLLVYILPNLAGELRVEDVHIRLEAVELLGKIFSSRQTAAEQYHSLFREYLCRCRDLDPSVRLAMVKDSLPNVLIETGPAHIDEILPLLEDRLHDSDDRVRLETVYTVCVVAIKDPLRVTSNLMKKVAERCLDKKQHVRRETLRHIAEVHAHYRDRMYSDKRTFAVFGHLGSRVMTCYGVQDQAFQHAVEDYFDTLLLPRPSAKSQSGSGTAEQEGIPRAEIMVHMFHHFDDLQKGLFKKMCNRKSDFVQRLLELLDAREAKKAAAKKNAEEKKKAESVLATCVKVIAGRLMVSGNTDAQELVEKLLQEKDEKIFAALRSLADPCLTFSQRTKLRDDCAARVGSKSALGELIGNMSTKLAPVLDGNVVEAIVKHLFTQVSPSRPERHIAPYLALLTALTECNSQLMSAAVDSLAKIAVKCAEIEYDDVLSKALEIIAATKTAAAPSGKNCDQLRQLLPDLAMGHSLPIAKHSIGCLEKVSAGSAMVKTLKSMVEKLVECLEESPVELSVTYDEETSARLQNSLKATAHLARRHPHHLLHHAAQIFDCVHDTILAPGDGLGSDSAEIKVLGMKVLSEFVRTGYGEEQSERLPVSPGKVVRLLTTVVQKGDTTSDSKISARQKTFLRQEAGVCLLRLCEATHLHSHMSLSTFHTIASLAYDPSGDLRAHFISKVHLYLMKRRLSLRYSAILALAMMDKDRGLSSGARSKFERYLDFTTRHAQAVGGDLPPVESVFPFIVHLLAHHPSFELQKPQYTDAVHVLNSTLDILLDPRVHRASVLLKLIDFIKGSRDRMKPKSTNAVVVAEIAEGLLHIKSDGRMHPGPLSDYLDKILYLLFTKRDGDSEQEHSLLPASFSLMHVIKTSTGGSPRKKTTKALQGGGGGTPKRKRDASQRAPKPKQGESSNEENTDEEVMPRQTTRRTRESKESNMSAVSSNGKPTHSDSEGEDVEMESAHSEVEEEMEEEEEDSPPPAKKRTTKTPVKKSPANKSPAKKSPAKKSPAKKSPAKGRSLRTRS